MVLCSGECAEGRQTVERLNNKYHQNHFPYSHHWWKSTFYSWGVGITGIFLFWPLFMCYCGVTKAILFITKRLIPTSDARQECGKFSDDRREKRENGAVQKDSHLRFRLHYRAGMLKNVLLQHLRSACSYTYLQKDNGAAQKKTQQGDESVPHA